MEIKTTKKKNVIKPIHFIEEERKEVAKASIDLKFLKIDIRLMKKDK